MRSGLSNNRAGLHKELAFLVLFLFVASVCNAETYCDPGPMNKWQYKLITEHALEYKCSGTIGKECISCNWRSKDNHTYRVLFGNEVKKAPIFFTIQANSYKTNTPSTTHRWEEVNGWMVSMPETEPSTNLRKDISDSPKLTYGLTLDRKGRYYLHIKGRGPNGSSNSVNYGIGTELLGTMDFKGGGWSNTTQDPGGKAFLDLDVGTYDFVVYMREDSARFSEIGLTLDRGYVPGEN